MRVPVALVVAGCTILVGLPCFVAWHLGGDAASLAVAVLPAWATMILKAAYDRWDPFYFWVNRAVMWVLNREVRWDLEAEWSDYEAIQTTLADLVQEVRMSLPRAVLRQDDSTQKILECTDSGYSVLIAQQGDPGETLLMRGNGNIVLRLHVTGMVVPFRFAERLLDRELVPMLSTIHKVLSADEEKYSVKVTFLGGNPYLGFYLRRVPLRDIRYLTCEFADSRAGANTVALGRESLTILSRDLTTVTSLAKKYLALSPPGQ